MPTFAESQGDVGMQVSALNKLAGLTALRMGQFQAAEQYSGPRRAPGPRARRAVGCGRRRYHSLSNVHGHGRF